MGHGDTKTQRILRFFSVSLCLCGPSSPCLAQQIGASRTVLATVVDNRGRPIVDVDPDDFVIRETGQARDVLSVRVADYPIVLVLDNGRGAGKDFEVMRQAAARFIARVGRRPVAVALADPPRLAATLDDDRPVVLDRLGKAGASRSAEGLFDSIVGAARAIQENGALFSAIVVISANPLSTAPGEFLTPVLASGTTVHAVVGREANTTAPGAESLRALVDQTSGRLTMVFAAASYQVALDRLADQLAPELMVEYVVPAGSSSDNDVQLGVRIPGARVNGRGVK
jgi:hypothetical protein